MEHRLVIKENKFGYQVYFELYGIKRVLLSPVLEDKPAAEDFVVNVRSAETMYSISESLRKKMNNKN